MPTYLIADIEVRDQAAFQEYVSRVPSFIAKHGGEYLVRAGDFEVIEGDWQPHRLIIFRFPDRQSIRNLFADPDYAELAKVRHSTTRSSIVAVDGIG